MSVFSGVETAIPEYALAKNQEESQANVDLFHAAEKGNLKSAKAAVASGGTPHFFYHPEDQKNSLHVASQGGHLEVVKYLLSVGAGLDVETGMDQSSSLVLAAQEGHLDVLSYLLSQGSDVNSRNMYGNSSLHQACRQGRFDIIDVLIENKAYINITNNKDSTPLHFICYTEDKNLNIPADVAKFIKAGADINAADSRGVVPLMAACTSGRLDLVKLLVSQGCDVALKDSSGRTAADIAHFFGNTSIVSYLKSL